MRSIDVEITLNPAQLKPDSPEVNYLCSELEFLLEENASPAYPFNILVK